MNCHQLLFTTEKFSTINNLNICIHYMGDYNTYVKDSPFLSLGREAAKHM